MNCFINSPFSQTLISGNEYKKLLRKTPVSVCMNKTSEENGDNKRRQILKFATVLSALSVFNTKPAVAEKTAVWERVSMPVDTVLFDLDFVKDAPKHGWLVGLHAICQANGTAVPAAAASSASSSARPPPPRSGPTLTHSASAASRPAPS